MIDNGGTITDPIHTANIFNNHSSTIVQKTQAKIMFCKKSFMDHLCHTNGHTFFIISTRTDKITNIISSLDNNKSTRPNSLSTKILKLLKNYVSIQLAKLFNISFSTVIFLSQLKTAKVIPYSWDLPTPTPFLPLIKKRGGGVGPSKS